LKEALIIMGILSSLFGCKKQPETAAQVESAGMHVTAQLNHLLMPIDRGERYEDPLDEALSAQGLGETSGGGTMQEQSGEIQFIDVEIDLTDLEKGVPFVIAKLEELGAPKGSILRVHDTEPAREIPFGKAEGVGIYLDGVNLPDEVYKNSDVNVVIEELNKRIEGHGEMQSHWQGNTETGLYFYGDDSNRMISLMRDFLDTYPLCKGARVVTIAPKQAKD
jgi:hypothetical protein